MRTPSERGQSTVEYVGVVAVLGVVLLAIVAAAGRTDGGRVAVAVQDGLARALCLVGGGACDADLAPCPTRWRRDRTATGLRVSLVRLGHGRSVLREERSDGSVAVTFAEDGELGLDAGVGARLEVVDAEARAAILARAGRGVTYELPDGRAADRLLALGRRGAQARPPDVSFTERPNVAVEGVGRVAAAGLGLEAAVAGGLVSGVRHERATGRRTFYLGRRAAGELSLLTEADLPLVGGRSGGGGKGDGAAAPPADGPAPARGGGRRALVDGERSEEIAVTVDRDGRPIDLLVLHTTRDGQTPGAEAALVVTESHLDLTDPGARAVAAAFLREARDGASRRGVRAAAVLAQRLDEAAVLHVRAYGRRRSSEGIDIGAEVGPVALGVRHGTETEQGHLVAASTRGPGGTWRDREDCDVA